VDQGILPFYPVLGEIGFKTQAMAFYKVVISHELKSSLSSFFCPLKSDKMLEYHKKSSA
jgi:hypothetical protein